jgi:LPS O-antigen subunit length determinant protein (WzzB/FepE family)
MEPRQYSQNSHPVYSDEIDLLQLCADLWQKRALIMLITFVVLAFGVSYAYMSPEVYKAEARLLPPPESSLSELTKVSGLAGVPSVSPQRAFQLTGQYLESMEVKRILLNSPVIAGYIEQAFPGKTEFEKLELLSKRMIVLLPDEKKKKNSTVVSVEWHDSGQAAELVNTWVELSMKSVQDELVTNIRVSLKNRIQLANKEIGEKKRLALSQMEMELLKLREAKIIADQNALVGPVDLTTESFVTNNPIFANVMELRALYLLGSKALVAEIGTLDSRRGNLEGYMPGFFELKERQMVLKKAAQDTYLMMPAKVDFRAVPSDKKVSPKRTLIILVSLAIGVIVGFFVALIIKSMEAREKSSN